MTHSALHDSTSDELLDELRIRQMGGYAGYSFLSTPTGEERAGPRSELSDYSCSELIARVVEIDKSVYGVDDRRDFYEIDDARVLANLGAVVSLFVDSHVTDTAAGGFKLRTQPLKNLRDLCPGQHYAQQPTGAFGTGFLVSPTLIATAGHNTRFIDASRIRCVFGFRMTAETAVQDEIAPEDVFSVTGVIAPETIERQTDWALLRLDRPVLHRPSVLLRRRGRISDDTPVYIIGHPDGLPVKYAGAAKVTRNAEGAIFIATLDAYGGNSGSPIFNALTHDVEGVLVSGAPDYAFNPETMCYEALFCPLDPALGPDRCTGESCLRVTEFAARVHPDPAPQPDDRPDPGPDTPDRPDDTAGGPADNVGSDGPRTPDELSRFARNLQELLRGILVR